MTESDGLIYLTIFIGPFIQEDAAVISAASLSATYHTHFPLTFITILLGLIASDAWKYWIGYAAHTHKSLRAMAEKDKVVIMGKRIQKNAIITLLAARFIPLARIPAYVACGYFKVPYWKFFITIAISASLYVSLVFMLIHYLSEILGDRIEHVLIAIGLIIITIIIGVIITKTYKGKNKA